MGKLHLVGELICFQMEEKTDEPPVRRGVIRYLTSQQERVVKDNHINILLEEGAIVEADCGEYWWVPLHAIK